MFLLNPLAAATIGAALENDRKIKDLQHRAFEPELPLNASASPEVLAVLRSRYAENYTQTSARETERKMFEDYEYFEITDLISMETSQARNLNMNEAIVQLRKSGYEAKLGSRNQREYIHVRIGVWSLGLMWDSASIFWGTEDSPSQKWTWLLSPSLDAFGNEYITGTFFGLGLVPSSDELFQAVTMILEDPCKVPLAVVTDYFSCPECELGWDRREGDELYEIVLLEGTDVPMRNVNRTMIYLNPELHYLTDCENSDYRIKVSFGRYPLVNLARHLKEMSRKSLLVSQQICVSLIDAGFNHPYINWMFDDLEKQIANHKGVLNTDSSWVKRSKSLRALGRPNDALALSHRNSSDESGDATFERGLIFRALETPGQSRERLEIFQKAMSRGSVDGLYTFALSSKDIEACTLAMNKLRDLSDLGRTDALMALTRVENHFNLPQTRFSQLLELANTGDAKAQFLTAKEYFSQGKYDQAIFILRSFFPPSPPKNMSEVQCKGALAQAIGSNRDAISDEMYEDILYEAAECGDTWSMVEIARGLGKHSVDERNYWLELAIGLDSSVAFATLGLICLRSEDAPRGIYLLKHALREGQLGCAVFIAQHYIETDRPRAIRFLKIASEQDHAESKRLLKELGELD